MQVGLGATLPDVEQSRYFFVALVFQDIEIEYDPVPIRKLPYHLQQNRYGDIIDQRFFASVIFNILPVKQFDGKKRMPPVSPEEHQRFIDCQLMAPGL